MRVLGFDVGQKNMAFCLVEAKGEEAARRTMCLALSEGALERKDLTIVAWQVLPLSSLKRPSVQDILEAVIALVRDRLELVASADLVAIETQMTRRMCVIAACLYSAVRTLAPQARVFNQSASLKLGFGDVPVFMRQVTVPLVTYAQRKRAAVQIARRLSESADEDAQRLFAASKKKDDLSDALLHALAALATRGAERAEPPRAKRPRAKRAASPR